MNDFVDPKTITPTERAIAELLHKLHCHWSHIDQCGWEYESWENPTWSRSRYIQDARTFLARATADEETLIATLRLALKEEPGRHRRT